MRRLARRRRGGRLGVGRRRRDARFAARADRRHVEAERHVGARRGLADDAHLDLDLASARREQAHDRAGLEADVAAVVEVDAAVADRSDAERDGALDALFLGDGACGEQRGDHRRDGEPGRHRRTSPLRPRRWQSAHCVPSGL
jgi:hypothetical protein